ncbi:MAG: hypothetical protein OYG32_18175 [Rhodospirillaceae bacterium]|nr:hypothetical protein [Rhodospirillaceae bacterium]
MAQLDKLRRAAIAKELPSESEAGEGHADPVAASDAQGFGEAAGPEEPSAPKSRRKAGPPRRKAISIKATIPLDLYMEVKREALETNRKMSDIVAEALAKRRRR